VKNTIPQKVRNKLQLEELEPRLLFSADWLGVFGQDDGVDSSEPEQSAGIEALPQPLYTAVAEQVHESRQELVFIDTRAPDYQQLLQHLNDSADSGRVLEIILLDPEQDGVTQISEALANRSGVDAIHIISHASDGAVQLGGSWLDSDSLTSSSAQVASWALALDDDADLLFYGCNLASGDSGLDLLERLSDIAGVDVAASTDLTGNASQGGDWILEYIDGNLDSSVVLNTASQNSYDGLLAANTNPSLANLDATLNYVEGDAPVRLDRSIDVSDTELDALDGGKGNYSGASVTLVRNGGANAADIFGYSNTPKHKLVGNMLELDGDIIASFDTTSPGQLTITFTDAYGAEVKTKEVEHFLEHITYSNNSSLPDTGVQIDWTINDGNTGAQGTGGAGIGQGNLAINTTGVNDGPGFSSLDDAPILIYEGAPVVLDTDVSINDPELDSLDSGNGNYAGSMLTLFRNGGANSDDQFGFVTANGISLVGSELHKGGVSIASFDTSIAGQLIITYTDGNGQTPGSADVNAIQRQITYDNSIASPPASIQIDWSFDDGNSGAQGSGGPLTDAGNVSVSVAFANELPVFSNLDATASYTRAAVP